MTYRFLTTMALFLTLFSAAQAQSPIPITLGPLAHNEARLSILATDGAEATYTPSELETFPTYRLTTTTPWRIQPATFDGVLLNDVLAAHGLQDTEVLRVEAENDYAVTLDKAVRDATPILLATRVDGRALSRRERGPILFVVGAEDYARLEVITERHLVWMARRIAPDG